MTDFDNREINLSPTQKGILFDSLSENIDDIYRHQFGFILSAQVNPATIQNAWQEILDKHDILRSTISIDSNNSIDSNSIPKQVIHTSAKLPYSYHDWRNLDQDSIRQKLRNHIQSCSPHQIELNKLPLLHLTIFQLSECRFQILLDYHHIILDIHSRNLLLNEFSSIITRKHHSSVKYEVASASFEQYIQYLNEKDVSINNQYWYKEFFELDSVNKLPFAHSRANMEQILESNTAMADVSSVKIELEECGRSILKDQLVSLKQLALQHSLKLDYLLYAAWVTLLARYNHSDELAFDVPFSLRTKDIENCDIMIGPMIRSVPVRLSVQPSDTIINIARAIEQKLSNISKHIHFDSPQDATTGRRAHVKSCDTLLVIDDHSVSNLHPTESSEIVISDLIQSKSTRYPFTLFIEISTDIKMIATYRRDLLDPLIVESILEQYAMALDPQNIINHTPYLDISLASLNHKNRVLSQWGSSKEKYPVSQCIHELFELQAALHPNNRAITYQGLHLTYGELNARSNQLARYLLEHHVQCGDSVGICLDRSLDLVVAILGTLKAGAAYVPIDPSYPDERKKFIVEDAQLDAIIFDSNQTKSHFISESKCIDLHQERSELDSHATHNLALKVEPKQLAYIIFTSGSTGKPKGVLIPHSNVVRLFTGTQHWYQFDSNDTWTLFHSYAFDFSVWEIWGALLHGGRLVIVPYWISRSPNDFRQLIKSEQVTVLNQTPSAFLKLNQAEELSIIDNKPTYKLPDNSIITHQNLSESQFLYREIFDDNLYLRHGIEINDGDCIFDIGANIGLFTLFANRQAESVKLFSFEPVPPVYELLKSNAILHGVDAVLYNCGLSKSTGQAHLTYYPNASVMSGFYADEAAEKSTTLAFMNNRHRLHDDSDVSAGNVEDYVTDRLHSESFDCAFTTISNVIKRHNVKRIDLLKIDVEKSEMDVLQGIVHEDWQIIRQLVIEVHDIDDRIGKVTQLLEKYKFDIVLEQDPMLKNTNIYSIYAFNRNTAARDYDTALNDISSCIDETPFERSKDSLMLSLKHIILGGEAFNPPSIKSWFLRYGDNDPEIVNMYGITETTVHVTYRKITKPDTFSNLSTIGTQIPDLEMYILDKHLEPVPIGITGELYVGGAGLANGYLHRPDLTAERFIAHPFSHNEDKLYKTGDTARYLPNGDIVYQGRCDNQVKIRGFRIELGEIESALSQHPDIQQCAVLVDSKSDNDNKRLLAYVACKEANRHKQTEFRSFLQERLPSHMVPALFLILEHFPLTENGKIDYRKLPDAEDIIDNQTSVSQLTEVSTEAEQCLQQVWKEVLDIKNIGGDSDFFELGGDSIMCIQVTTKVALKGYHLTPKMLYQYPVLANLAKAMKRSEEKYTQKNEQNEKIYPINAIQSWFFSIQMPVRHHWNQSMVLNAKKRIDPSILNKATEYLIKHHKALRNTYIESDGMWHQCASTTDSLSNYFYEYNLFNLSSEDQQVEYWENVEKLQKDFDLSKPPLIRVAVFDYSLHKPQQIVVIIHHLVVDTVSWRILLEDLSLVCGQIEQAQKPQLPMERTSYQWWCSESVRLANSEAIKAESNFWLTTPRKQVKPLLTDMKGGDNLQSSSDNISIELSSEHTFQLQEYTSRHGCQSNEVILAALSWVLSFRTVNQLVLIDVGGHGREEDVISSDSSRTVGWFTSLYPILVDLRRKENTDDLINYVNKQWQGLPSKGMSYGMLKYLCADESIKHQFENLPQADISFNHLGNVDNLLSSNSKFELVNKGSGNTQTVLGQRHHLLDVVSYIRDGCLKMDWYYTNTSFNRDTIEYLARATIIEIEHLMGRKHEEIEVGASLEKNFANQVSV